MTHDPNKVALRLSPQMREQVKQLYEQDNCRSQNEFIEKAIRFYTGYLSAQDCTQYLSDTLLSVFQGSLADSENRMARLLFKLAVETSLMMHVLAANVDITDDELYGLRRRPPWRSARKCCSGG